jgi:hypothetical protein
VGYLNPSRTGLNLMNLRPWKMSFKTLDTIMRKSTTKKNSPRNERRKVRYDSRGWELNRQDSRMLGGIPGWASLPKV